MLLIENAIRFVIDEIHVVKDGKFGTPDPSNPSGWSGMIGELLNNVSITSDLNIFWLSFSLYIYD